jgi:sterol desaturase/sphingolipid hydroxylase (fatty acid hydroxylase superfamily)
MDQLLSSVWAHYHWLYSLYAVAGMVALTTLVGVLKAQSPSVRVATALNKATFQQKMEQAHYAENHKWNRKWAPVYMAVIFIGIMPFCLTLAPQPWWRAPLGVFVILMVYDFVYYLAHRFVFHDSPFMGGPLKWMHAVHHRQHNPCAGDSSYIHPLESAIGLGLFIGTVFVLSRVMGEFHVVTFVISWFAFMGVNVHNHSLWEAEHWPFQVMKYASRMHHNHHANFTGGNFGTITLLYDWMFGTLDNGGGYKSASAAKRTTDTPSAQP